MEVGGQIHALVHLSPRERAPGIHWIVSCVGSRAGLKAMPKRKKNPCPCRESNLPVSGCIIKIPCTLHWT